MVDPSVKLLRSVHVRFVYFMLHFNFQKKFSDAGKRAHVSLHEKESEAQALLRSRVETRELRGAPSMTVTNDRSARRARQRGLQCGTSSLSCRRACGQKECSRQITIESSTVSARQNLQETYKFPHP